MEKNNFSIEEDILIGGGPFLYNVTRDTENATHIGLVAGSSPLDAYKQMTLTFWERADGMHPDLQDDYENIGDYRDDYPFEEYNFQFVGTAL